MGHGLLPFLPRKMVSHLMTATIPVIGIVTSFLFPHVHDLILFDAQLLHPLLNFLKNRLEQSQSESISGLLRDRGPMVTFSADVQRCEIHTPWGGGCNRALGQIPQTWSCFCTNVQLI